MNARLPGEIFAIPLPEAPGSASDPDRYVLYAPLRQSAFIAHAEVVNALAELREPRDDGALHAADERLAGFLRSLGWIDAAVDRLPAPGPMGEPMPTSVTLFLTTGCSMRCTYCYAAAGDTPHESMPIEVARRGIDFVAGNAKRLGAERFSLAFHGGGEPTLNWRVLTSAYEYAKRRARELGLECTASTATNGVLNEVQIAWITRHLASASVSFDGDPEVQDSQRPLANGAASSERVLHTLARFDAAGFDYGIRVTVTAERIARLPQAIDFICRHTERAPIQVEPAYRMGRWKEAPSAETAQFIERFRQAREVARGHGRTLGYSAARVGLLTRHFCGVSQDSFALSPGGNVSACFEVFSERSEFADTFFYGRPAGEGGAGHEAPYAFDLQRLEALRALSVDRQPFCQGCFARWHCAGDCHRNALSVDASGQFQGSDRCHITRALTLDQILERIAEEEDGLAWRGGRRPAGGAT
jgi:uncharacterized protein